MGLMKNTLLLAVAAALGLQTAHAANAFAGSNLYYAAGLNSDETTTLLSAMQSAGMKVLRVWLDGQSSDQKGTSITPFPDLEPSKICNGDNSCYNDKVLQLYDNFMVQAHSYGIKLLIDMHSFNALQAGDVYGKAYGTGDFYTDSNAQSEFDARLVHIVNHVHTTLGKPWKELSDYIFGFEAENEAMIGKGQSYIQDHQQWQCDRATTIKNQLGDNSGILVLTGGASWVAESVQPDWLSCDALDVLSLHGYGTGDFSTSSLQGYVKQAQQAGKMLLFEEWGACYFNTENNDCPSGGVLDTNTRNANIKSWSSSITAAGIPWLYWQVLPNSDPHDGYDYEIGVQDPSWETLKEAAQSASQATAAFDYSAYLL